MTGPGPFVDPDVEAAGSAAEQRREDQRQSIRAARRARVLAVAPWVAVVALLAVAFVCAVLAARPGPLQGTAGPAEGRAATLSVEGVLPTLEATPGAPIGVAVSGDRVYVAEPQRGVVSVFTLDGSRVATVGAGWLRTPVYVAVGPVDGRVYVSDRGRGTVGVFAQDGKRFGVLTPSGLRPGSSAGPAWRPLALAFGPEGTLYVADSGRRQSVLVFTPAGSRAGSLGADVPVGRTGGRLAFVNGIAVTSRRVVVADSNNGRLLVFDRSGRFLTQIPSDGLPRGVAVTASGRIVTTNAASDAVTLMDPAGAVLQSVTGGVGERERFVSPSGIAADDGDGLFVADAATGQVFLLHTGEVPAGSTASAAVSRLLLVVAAALAAILAVGVAMSTVRRTRARVREAGVTL